MPSTLRCFAIALVSLAAALGVPAAAGAETPPDVTTLPVTDVTATGATFHARVAANGAPTTTSFVYGTEPGQLTERTAVHELGTEPGGTWLDVSVSELMPNTTYYVAAVAAHGDLVFQGETVTLQTAAAPEIRSGQIRDVTSKSATVHLDVVTHGQAAMVFGSYRRDTAGGGPDPLGGGAFGPVTVSADGDVALPLRGLLPGVPYSWTATARNPSGVAGKRAGGQFSTPALFAIPRPEVSAPVAPYGSRVTIKGGTGGKAGVVVTLNARPYPFSGPFAPLAGMTATTDAGGFYAFEVRAERSTAYGVTADGAQRLLPGDLAPVRVSAVVTASLRRARDRRSVVSGSFQPGVASAVSLYRQGAGRVGDVLDVTRGAFRFPARTLRPGRYEVRVTPLRFTGIVKARSAPLTVPRPRRR